MTRTTLCLAIAALLSTSACTIYFDSDDDDYPVYPDAQPVLDAGAPLDAPWWLPDASIPLDAITPFEPDGGHVGDCGVPYP